MFDLDDIALPTPARRKPRAQQKPSQEEDFEDSSFTWRSYWPLSLKRGRPTTPEDVLQAVAEILGPGTPMFITKIVGLACLRGAAAAAAATDAAIDAAAGVTSKRVEDILVPLYGRCAVEFAPKKSSQLDKWNSIVCGVANLDAKTVTRMLLRGLTDDQKEALRKMIRWVDTRGATEGSTQASSNRYFILRGYAGTGKTFLLKRFNIYCRITQPKRTQIFTAPTNKAARVLRQMVDCKAKTIHSELKLSMTEDEDKQVLKEAEEATVSIPRGSLITLDEAGMGNTQVAERLNSVAANLELQVLLVGDPAQLRPVGEYTSPLWSFTDKAEHIATLKEVRRNDNQVLALTTRIRKALSQVVRNPEKAAAVATLDYLLKDDNDGMLADSGVYRLKNKEEFLSRILTIAKEQGAAGFRDTRVLAWRNKVVDEYTRAIRDTLGFPENRIASGEIVLLASPLTKKDFRGKHNIIATIDEEFEATTVLEKLAGPETPELRDVYASNASLYLSTVKYYEVGTTTSGITLSIEDSDSCDLEENLNKLATAAKKAAAIVQGLPWGSPDRKIQETKRRKLWTDFWNMNRFFTKTRYGYCHTCHRAQGSTYVRVFVDALDLFSNPDAEERLQLAYVGSSRPSRSIYYFA